MVYRYSRKYDERYLPLVLGTSYKINYLGRYIYQVMDFKDKVLCNISLKTLNYCFEKLD